MKTKEFKKRVEELGYGVINGEEYYYIKDFDGEIIASVNKLIMFQICTDFDAWDELSPEIKKELFDVISKYASTPPDEREEEKKFYLRHRWFKCINGDSRYFQIYEANGAPWLNAMYSIMGYKKQFTLKEIEEIKEKYNTDLSDFEMIEVEE